jgi:very-short-patch-repair endonuclease
MTDAERKLWWRLRSDFPDLHFRRQAPVGPYFADFACHKSRIVVEVDGGQHMHADHAEKDSARNAYLAKQGYRVLRFWNNDVLKNIDGVLTTIHDELMRGSQSQDAPHPRPLPTASRGEGRLARSAKR